MRADHELLQAWRDGEAGAGNTLLERHFDRLYRFFTNKIGQDAEDLIQQTMLACVQSRDKVTTPKAFTGFLLKVARNKLYDHLRSRSRDKVDPDLGVTSVVALGVSPSSVFHQDQRKEKLAAALRELPVHMQVALELYYWEELSIDAIAEIQEVASGTVKSRLKRGREKLAALYGELPERIDPPRSS